MRLNEEEYYQYIKLHIQIIYYVGKKKNLIPASTTFKEFMSYPTEDRVPVRNAVYENIEMLDDYIADHSENLSEEEKEIILDFKNFKQGTFYVMKLTKKYAYFFGDNRIYGVYALSDPFQMILGNNLPTMVGAVLLPFKGKIVYDGMISTYPIHFGRGVQGSIKNDYRLSEAKYGVITELPEKIDNSILKNSAEKELLVLMKTKASREYNKYEIADLLLEHPELESVHTKEWGRINSRAKKKELKGLGIQKRWFAMYNNTILLSSKSEKELKIEVKKLIQDDKHREGIYYFKM